MRRPSARRRRATSGPDGAAMTSERGPWSRLRREAGWHRLGSLPPSPPPPRPPRRAAPHAWVRRLRHAAVWLALAEPVNWRSATATASSSPICPPHFLDRLGGEIVPYAAVTTEDGAVRVRAHRDGHFYIDSRVNGQGVRFLVDTGASVVALSPDDAERIGFDRTRLNFSQRLHTAGGVVRAAPVVIRTLELGDIRLTLTCGPSSMENGCRTPCSASARSSA